VAQILLQPPLYDLAEPDTGAERLGTRWHAWVDALNSMFSTLFVPGGCVHHGQRRLPGMCSQGATSLIE
jgi:hypothetical protein